MVVRFLLTSASSLQGCRLVETSSTLQSSRRQRIFMQAMLRGSTMDRSALREFLYVLSLEYRGPKAAGILAALPPPEADSTVCDLATPASPSPSPPPPSNAGSVVVARDENGEARRLGARGMVLPVGTAAGDAAAPVAWPDEQVSVNASLTPASTPAANSPGVDRYVFGTPIGACPSGEIDMPPNAELEMTPQRGQAWR